MLISSGLFPGSHGKSAVKCSFSINKNLLVQNISEQILISQSILTDLMKSNDYKPVNIPLSNELIISLRNPYNRHIEVVADRQRRELHKEKTERKEPNDEKSISVNIKVRVASTYHS